MTTADLAFATLPPRTAPFAAAGVDGAATELRAVIEDAIVNSPRSLQKQIGPSEIGDPCDHCLAAKLAGWSKNDDGIPWLPFIGTSVHAELERIITDHEISRNALHTTGMRWLCENRVTVGQIGGVDISGSTDLFDTQTGATFDWKIVGESTLRKARKGTPSQTYRVQAHLYGRGWVAAGHEVRDVAIWFLPRNDAAGITRGVLWHEPYDEQIALDALARANRLHANLTALASISTAARDQWITALPRDPDCWDCARYPDGAGLPKPGHRPPANNLAGLIP